MKIKRKLYNELTRIAEARIQILVFKETHGIDERLTLDISLRELVQREYIKNYGTTTPTHRVLFGPIEFRVLIKGSCHWHGVYMCDVCPPVGTNPAITL